MFNIGSQELLLILLLVFIFFGPRYLPDTARTLGKGLGEIQRALHGVETSVRRATEETVQVERKLPSIFDPDVVPDPPRPDPPRQIAAATAAAGPIASGEAEDEESDAETLNPS